MQKMASASLLPPAWDELAQYCFQKRAFYTYTEQYNPCKQRYYLLYQNNRLMAGASVYSIRIDLLTFLNIPSPVNLQVVGIPATVAPGGLIGDKASVEILLQHILASEKGLVVGMNTPADLNCHPATPMRNMPTIVIQHNHNAWDEYLTSLRSDYRRRMKKINRKFEGVTEVVTDCSVFTQQHYGLYLQVYKRSKSKVEKLSFDFFKNLPPEYKLTTYYAEETPLCWHITIEDGEVLWFFFGGTDYSLNAQYHAYFNNIANLVKHAINKGFKVIDLGQTAEVPKTRLGGVPRELYLFIYHRNKLLNFLLRKGAALLQYNRKIPATNVFNQPTPS